MLFTTLDFGIFLPIVFLIYWAINPFHLKLQNVLIVAASYIFYGWWDWRFLILIFLSTLVDFSLGRVMGKEKSPVKRKLLLYGSLGFNLGLLAFFKYCNFFIESFSQAFSLFGTPVEAHTLDLILPVGISFYTFQTLSYTIDIYRRRLDPTQDLIQFMAFVSFFPQLVAGPIERARDLLPQFYKKRTFNYAQAVDGCRQILWGLVKKVVIADNCAHAVHYIFENPGEVDGAELLLGAIVFFVQVYGDFSGYSDIAIGIAKLFGFRLSQNFNYPLFSRNMIEFWQRWHISLSTWLRDYLYIPLGGSRGSLGFKIRNVMITFVLCGFWHGPEWKFIVWGGLHGLYMILTVAIPFSRRHREIVAFDRHLPPWRDLFGIILTFWITASLTVFYRVKTVEEGFNYLYLTYADPLSWFSWNSYAKYSSLLIALAVFFGLEWMGRRRPYALAHIGRKWPQAIRWSLYAGLVLLVIYFQFSHPPIEFIYFQF